MQSKQALVGIITAAIILIGAAGVFLYSQNKPSEKQPISTSASVNEENKSEMTSSLSELLKSEQTQECSFSYDEISGGKTSGITYLSGENMRTDLTMDNNNKITNVYVVRNGNDSYIWGSEFPNNTGLRMTISVDELVNGESTKKYFDPDRKLNYNCKPWTIDASVFIPPSNIKFSDLSQMMQGFMNTTKTSGAPTGTTNNCSMCNFLTGDAKNACTQQLGC